MLAVVQRVDSAEVEVKGEIISQIDVGYLVLLGCEKGDSDFDVEYIAKKIANLRVFQDNEDKMNLSIKDIGGKIILVSQFTLLGQTRKGNRPSFTKAELPEKAEELYLDVANKVRLEGIDVQTGIFGADMNVRLLNDGPVTIILNSKDTRQ